MTCIQPAPKQRDSALDVVGAKDHIAAIAFRFYKSLVSPALHAVAPSRCLYLPTCSEYAYTAVERFGAAHGSWLALRRFARCHPWGKGGLDPVPSPATPCRPQSAVSASSRSGANHLP